MRSHDPLKGTSVRACVTRLYFHQTRSAWSVDQGSNKDHSPAYNFAPTVTKFCVMWEGLSLPHDTKFGNCRCKIVDSRAFPSWSLIHGLRWSGLIKAEPGDRCFRDRIYNLPYMNGRGALGFTSSDTHILLVARYTCKGSVLRPRYAHRCGYSVFYKP